MFAVIALCLPSLSFAGSYGGGYSGGRSFSSGSSFHSSPSISSYGGGFKSSVTSIGSFKPSTSGSSYGGGYSTGYKSSGSFIQEAPKATVSGSTAGNTAPTSVSAPSTNTYYQPTHISYYNPFTSDFFFWYWIFGNHSAKPTVINNVTNVVATSTATTTATSTNLK